MIIVTKIDSKEDVDDKKNLR